MIKHTVLVAISILFFFAGPISALPADPALESAMHATCEMPKGGRFDVIPDSKTASIVAADILKATYGPNVFIHQLPLSVVERDGRFIINGVPPKIYVGGSPTVILCRSNGAVLYIYHSK